ncbi:hypothetical protein H7X65_02165, partial [Candidatus Parcubacteria bacterium]|nr:hypothetical protein [Candidatus Parcubacteria bacterium]
MNKTIFTLLILFILSFSVSLDAATNAASSSTNTGTNTSGGILNSLIPWKKNCTYATISASGGGLYEPFSDITSNFPGGRAMMSKGKNNVDCVNVKTDGVESLLKLLFTTAITIIIVLTVISISVAGIQYMTEQATGQIKGG